MRPDLRTPWQRPFRCRLQLRYYLENDSHDSHRIMKNRSIRSGDMNLNLSYKFRSRNISLSFSTRNALLVAQKTFLNHRFCLSSREIARSVGSMHKCKSKQPRPPRKTLLCNFLPDTDDFTVKILASWTLAHLCLFKFPVLYIEKILFWQTLVARTFASPLQNPASHEGLTKCKLSSKLPSVQSTIDSLTVLKKKGVYFCNDRGEQERVKRACLRGRKRQKQRRRKRVEKGRRNSREEEKRDFQRQGDHTKESKLQSF